ncbi:hypothetical protein PRZ48_007322 [Zasmidium cellare]|uniref:TauD/TfdA-like domain-containing protein n=1 Tax=Zasmidium cellare TaxID=395010 RepID=A0ABR0EJW3_ZASCE|nr:hypothetical protein PRZ48_007322 [Zasmidium cellare]
MADKPMTPGMLDGAWMPQDAETNKDRWMHRLSSTEIEGLDKALRTSQSKGHNTCNTMTKEDFPLNAAMVEVLSQLLDHVENDMGMFVIRGIPYERYSKDEMRMLYWGIGLHLGTAVTQSGKGDLLGDVKFFGHKTTVNANTGRGYMLNVGLSFHSDSSDIVSLIVLRTAPEGGRSMICSSIAVRNEIARRRPDLLKVLYEDFYWGWKGSGPPGFPKWYKQPVFTEHNGKFSARQVPPHIESAQDFPEVPRLTEKQREAFNFVDKVANEEHMHFGMMFEPGDIQFLNNHITFHARTEFKDGDTEDTKRHQLRMWLAPKNSRELSPSCGFFADKTAGVVRGGFPGATDELLYETPAVDL